jgi:hypothetical protein
MPTIRIDDEVYAWLQNLARPFKDTPNSVLWRIAKLTEVPKMENNMSRKNLVSKASSGAKTPHYAFRDPIIKIPKKLGGQG